GGGGGGGGATFFGAGGRVACSSRNTAGHWSRLSRPASASAYRCPSVSSWPSPLTATISRTVVGLSTRESKKASAGNRFSLKRGASTGVISSAGFSKREVANFGGSLRAASSNNTEKSICGLSSSLRRDRASNSHAPSVHKSASRNTSATRRV